MGEVDYSQYDHIPTDTVLIDLEAYRRELPAVRDLASGYRSVANALLVMRMDSERKITLNKKDYWEGELSTHAKMIDLLESIIAYREANHE